MPSTVNRNKKIITWNIKSIIGCGEIDNNGTTDRRNEKRKRERKKERKKEREREREREKEKERERELAQENKKGKYEN